MPHILVIGASGFTGRHVVEQLVKRHAHVTCLVRPTSDRRALEPFGVRFVEGDLDDPASIEAALAGHDTLVYISNLLEDHTRITLQACRATGMRRGVFISSTGIFTTLDAESKQDRGAAEALVMASGMDYTILRPTMIYGTPGDRNMIRLIRFLRRSPLIPIFGSGDYKQQPIHVEDLARAVADCLDEPATIGQAYNLAGREPNTYNEVVDLTCAAMGVRRFKLHLPVPLSLWAVRSANRLLGRTLFREEQVLRLNEHKHFDYSAAARDFGFSPRPFAEGIRQEVAQC